MAFFEHTLHVTGWLHAETGRNNPFDKESEDVEVDVVDDDDDVR